MSAKLEIVNVDKYDRQNNWHAETLFSGYVVRATLIHSNDMIGRISDMARLKKRLLREVGEEGQTWKILPGPNNDGYDLYLMNTGKLIMWKLQDHISFNTLFERVEQHREDFNEIRDNS